MDAQKWLVIFTGLLALFGTAALSVYRMSRMVRSDGQGDQLIASYKARAEYAEKVAEEERNRADRFAAERNDAVRRVGELEGVVSGLSGKVSHLEEQVEALSRTNELLLKLLAEKEDIPVERLGLSLIVPNKEIKE